MKEFRILSVNISTQKGTKKKKVPSVKLLENFGIEGDAHAGSWHRQVSLLAQEDIDIMRKKLPEIDFGDFAENITTSGICLDTLPIGTRLAIGDVILEVTQIGKECHSHCEIFQQVGDCVMPRKGIFARVIRGGVISDQSTGTYNIG